MQAFLIILILLFITPVARADFNSAARGEGESFEAARARLVREAQRAGRELNASRIPMTGASFLSSLDYRYSPQYASLEEVRKAFVAARDHLYYPEPRFPGYYRRLTWLYPDDGCYARADLTVRLLSQLGFPRPGKVFAVGPLSVRTPNHPKGHVEWVYHVAPVVNVGLEAYVIDPALEPTRPLGVFEWFARMHTNMVIKGMICEGATYGPFDDCDAPHSAYPTRATADMRPFLPREWQRQLELGRNPAALLLGLPGG